MRVDVLGAGMAGLGCAYLLRDHPKLDLRFRPAIITYLLVDRPRVSESHCLYMADASNILDRVAEFKNFNPYAGHLPADKTVLCHEVARVEDRSVERVGAFRADEPRLLMVGRNAQFEHMDVDEIHEAAVDYRRGGGSTRRTIEPAGLACGGSGGAGLIPRSPVHTSPEPPVNGPRSSQRLDGSSA